MTDTDVPVEDRYRAAGEVARMLVRLNEIVDEQFGSTAPADVVLQLAQIGLALGGLTGLILMGATTDDLDFPDTVRGLVAFSEGAS